MVYQMGMIFGLAVAGIGVFLLLNGITYHTKRQSKHHPVSVEKNAVLRPILGVALIIGGLCAARSFYLLWL